MELKLPPIGLTYSRDQLPQLGPIEGFLANLRKAGITWKECRIAAHRLKSSQMEFNREAIIQILKDEHPTKSRIVISSDNYVLDGHHRWAARYNTNESVSCIRVNLPILDLIQLAKTFKTSTYKPIESVGRTIHGIVSDIRKNK